MLSARHLPRLLTAFILAAALSLAGCEVVDTTLPGPTTTPDVFIVNQGNFGDGNGSVSTYNSQTGEVRSAAISPQLGTILQSGALINNDLYLAGNTGDQIDIFDTTTLDQIAQIDGIAGPRYMAQTDASTAYVTSTGDFGEGGFVTVIDVNSGAVLQDIDVGGNAEGIAAVGDRAVVATGAFGATDEVAIISTTTHSLIETTNVGCDAPRLVEAISRVEVAVICSGRTTYDDDWNVVGRTDGAVHVLDPATGNITAQFPVDGQISTIGPGQDAFFVQETDDLYVVRESNAVIRINLTTGTSTVVVSPVDPANIGAVAYHAGIQQLFLGRPDAENPYTSSGHVTIHDHSGSVVDEFGAGIAPAHIVVREVLR